MSSDVETNMSPPPKDIYLLPENAIPSQLDIEDIAVFTVKLIGLLLLELKNII